MSLFQVGIFGSIFAWIRKALKFKKHYISAINELIRLLFIIDEKSQTVEGTLLEVEQDSITVDTEKKNLLFRLIV